MNEGPTQDAPELGEPTDAEPNTDDTSAVATEQTMQTPDELGGTGGGQAGGAG